MTYNRNNTDLILLNLGRCEGKIDALLAQQKQVQKELDDHSNRIIGLEKYKSWQMGVAAVIASCVATLVGFIKGGH